MPAGDVGCDREEVRRGTKSFSRPTTRTRAEASTCGQNLPREKFLDMEEAEELVPRQRMRRRRRRGAIRREG